MRLFEIEDHNKIIFDISEVSLDFKKEFTDLEEVFDMLYPTNNNSHLILMLPELNILLNKINYFFEIIESHIDNIEKDKELSDIVQKNNIIKQQVSKIINLINSI